MSAEELGKLQEIPHGFLQAILADLRRAGIVMRSAASPAAGGWAKPAADVSVADVIRAVDGPLVSVYGLRPEAVSYNERAEVLQHVWIAARHSLRDVFEQVTIERPRGRQPAAGRHGPHRGRGRLAAPLSRARRQSSRAHPTAVTQSTKGLRVRQSSRTASSSSGVWMIGSKP